MYYCGFRLFSSLAELMLKHPDKAGRALFLHLPQTHSTDDIALGRDIAIASVTALADDDILKEDQLIVN